MPTCVFRPIVTARFGIVTAEFGIVTGRSGDVTDRVEDRCEAGSRHVKGSAVGVAH